MSIISYSSTSSRIVQNNLNAATKALNQSIERLTTGAKINHAKDNAANYSIAQNMSSKISSYEVAEENAMMGIDMVQTAESAVEQMANLTTRLRALAEQAQNGTYGEQSLAAINQEAQAIVDEITRIQSTTEYNGIQLLSSSDSVTGYAATGYTFSMSLIPSNYPAYRVVLQDGECITVPQSQATDGYVITSSGAISSGGAVTRLEGSNVTTYNKFMKNPTIVSTEGAVAASQVVTFEENHKYTISNAEDLRRLSTANYASGAIYILTDDIDLNGVDYASGMILGEGATFYGQGHVIKNYYSTHGGLFANVYSSATIQDIGLENVRIESDQYAVGGLVNRMSGPSITISNCYISGDVDIVGNGDVAGLVAQPYYDGSSTIQDCYITPNAHIESTSTWGYDGVYICVTPAKLNNVGIFDLTEGGGGSSTNLQVGIDSGEGSRIELNYSIPTMTLDSLVSRGLQSSDSLSIIDDYLSTLSDASVKLGAVENRLSSALESINVAYDNLVSSRSTLQDADVAKVSSEYIKHQILQQASATLLATANQSPTIALRLLGAL